jgi:hypothetical protein
MITAAEIKEKYPHHLQLLEVGDGWVGLVDEFIQAVFAHYEKIGRSELESSFKLMLAHQKNASLFPFAKSAANLESSTLRWATGTRSATATKAATA